MSDAALGWAECEPQDQMIYETRQRHLNMSAPETAAGIQRYASIYAHKVEHLAMMRYGVAVARRAWLTRADVLNTRPWTEFSAWLSRRESVPPGAAGEGDHVKIPELSLVGMMPILISAAAS